jgi:hypothetical protein
MPPHPSRSAHFRAIHDGTDEQSLDASLAAPGQPKEQQQQTQQSVHDWDLLLKLDRYERRALSRRNAAGQAFDEAVAALRGASREQADPVWQNEPKAGRPAP